MTYLTGAALSDQIREVMRGKNPRMCVAFLGPKWIEEIWPKTKKMPDGLQVICDLKMKATPKAALIAGKAPDNDNLRHLPGTEMHAKVYMSDIGAVVCSANASYRGLSSATRIEDGIFVPKASNETFDQIQKQFDERWDVASIVSQPDIDAAPDNLPATERSQLPDRLTLLHAMRDFPDDFGAVKFVCTMGHIGDQAQKDAEAELSDQEGETFEAENFDYFFGWTEEETRACSDFFFALDFAGRKIASLEKRRNPRFVGNVEDAGEELGVFAAEKLSPDAAQENFAGLPRLASNDRCIEEMQVAFNNLENLEKFDGQILTAKEFLDLLDTNTP